MFKRKKKQNKVVRQSEKEIRERKREREREGRYLRNTQKEGGRKKGKG